jgi:hypothetical protein
MVIVAKENCTECVFGDRNISLVVINSKIRGVCNKTGCVLVRLGDNFYAPCNEFISKKDYDALWEH